MRPLLGPAHRLVGYELERGSDGGEGAANFLQGGLEFVSQLHAILAPANLLKQTQLAKRLQMLVNASVLSRPDPTCKFQLAPFPIRLHNEEHVEQTPLDGSAEQPVG